MMPALLAKETKMKNSLELMLLEMLFNKKNEAPPKKKLSGELTVKQMLKLMKTMPTFKKEFEEALKALEPKKDKDKLTLGQKYMLWTLAAVTLPPLYVVLMNAVFTAVTGK